MSDTALSILQRAHDELLERERLLGRFADELVQTARARNALAKELRRLGGVDQKVLTAASEHNTGRRQPATVNIDEGIPKQIMDAVTTSLDPLDLSQIAEKIGRKPAGWIGAQCAQLAKHGHLVNIAADGQPARYGLPGKLDKPTGLDLEANVPAV